MKKVLFTVALMISACTASAQLSVVKEAKALKAKPEEAAKVLQAAFTNSETAADPETWKLAGDLQKAIFDEENMKMYVPGSQADTAKYYKSLVNMFEYYVKCDEAEQAKVNSGDPKYKKLKYRKKDADILKGVRGNLVNAGADAYNKSDYEGALKYFGMYVDAASEPLFSEDATVKADTLNALYANYATMAAAMVKNNDKVLKYGNIGKEDQSEGWRSLMYMAETYGKELNDTTKWVETLEEGMVKFPTQDYFVGNIMDYYINKGQTDKALEKINQLLAENETPYYLYVQGVLLYEKKQYDDAIASFNKIISKNENLVPEATAKIGDCYFFQAQVIVEENASLNVDDPKYSSNDDQIKALYEQAKPYYEKAKELAPDNKQLWGNYLLNIYWKLNRGEYEALEKELGY
jgi:tetratricopeptide (TPR) repeat protein